MGELAASPSFSLALYIVWQKVRFHRISAGLFYSSEQNKGTVFPAQPFQSTW